MNVKPFRCAVYTRKSTEHNLDLAFNSLDAQREACEAYIKSQAHEGWRLVPERYDDGGLSGASLERPAVQELLSDIRTGKIDIVVVYKVDRLTRSLADFAKLVELFDAHGVSFVSVTQAFNTTGSMGRLTLNVLLSFAQFEREVIGERVRDKVAASKRKGIWVGGPVPLGYVSRDKNLEVVPEEAETVRVIFRRYLDLGSIGALLEDLEAKGIRTRRQKVKDGIRGGIRFGVGSVTYLLRNRFYVGEVAYRGEVTRGAHVPIVDRALFDAVQERLAANAVERRLRLRGSSALLTGRLYDDRGNRMTPTHANKRGVRYRYYVSHALLQRRKDQAGSVPRVSAPELEAAVVSALRERFGQGGGGESGTEGSAATKAASPTDRDLVERHLERASVKPDAIELLVRDGHPGSATPVESEGDSGRFDQGSAPGTDLAGTGQPAGGGAESRPQAAAGREEAIERLDGLGAAKREGPEPVPSGRLTAIILPFAAPSFRAAKGLLHAPAERPGPMAAQTREALLLAIAKARCWIDDLAQGRAASFAEIAAQEGRVERHVRALAPLAFVSPRVIEAIEDGRGPASLTVTSLARALPHSWAEGERAFGL